MSNDPHVDVEVVDANIMDGPSSEAEVLAIVARNRPADRQCSLLILLDKDKTQLQITVQLNPDDTSLFDGTPGSGLNLGGHIVRTAGVPKGYGDFEGIYLIPDEPVLGRIHITLDKKEE